MLFQKVTFVATRWCYDTAKCNVLLENLWYSLGLGAQIQLSENFHFKKVNIAWQKKNVVNDVKFIRIYVLQNVDLELHHVKVI